MFNNIPTESEDELTGATKRINIQTMAEMVYPRPRRVRFPARLVFVVALLSATVGCATSRPAAVAEPETVGNLSASYHSVAVAPVHASTDFAPAAAVADTGDDVPVQGKTSLDVLRAEVASGAGDVAVAAKADGVTVGGAR